jgi:hypothetical protein
MKIIENVKIAGRFLELLINFADKQKVSEFIEKERMSRCMKCVNFTSKWGFSQCIECGCNLDLKTKLVYDTVSEAADKLKKAECPLGYW